jgi:hypothetical protein
MDPESDCSAHQRFWLVSGIWHLRNSNAPVRTDRGIAVSTCLLLRQTVGVLLDGEDDHHEFEHDPV